MTHLISVCHIGDNLNVSMNNTPETEDANLIELCVQSRNTRHREIIKIKPVRTFIIEQLDWQWIGSPCGHMVSIFLLYVWANYQRIVIVP